MNETRRRKLLYEDRDAPQQKPQPPATSAEILEHFITDFLLEE